MTLLLAPPKRTTVDPFKRLKSPFTAYENRILIIGDFKYDNFETIQQEIRLLPENSVIMIPRTKNNKHFPGATAIAQWIAREEGYPVFEIELIYSNKEKKFSPYTIESLIKIFQPTKILNFGSLSGDAYHSLIQSFLTSAKKNKISVHYINSNRAAGRSSRTVVPMDYISQALSNGTPIEEILYA